MASIIAIDQGTSSTKALLFSDEGRLIAREDIANVQTYPHPGWVEQDAEKIYQGVLESIRRLPIQENKIQLLSISNQRETVVVWDRISGKPIYPAIIWQCNRASDLCESLEAHKQMVFQKTGLVLSPYFSASKIAWILEHIQGARYLADAGRLLWGTIDCWLVWKLTGRHATDISNASRTQLLNIHTLKWDADLSELFHIPPSMHPEVLDSNAFFGDTDLGGLLPKKIPIHGVMGDSQAAMFGQGCFFSGNVKATYGTGSSVAMMLGKTPRLSNNGLVTSVAWGISGQTDFIFEGNINCTGATIRWLIDHLRIISDVKDAAILAAQTESSEGVYLVPAFVGLGAPYWKSDARALICGLTRGSSRGHIVRAAEECIAYQIKDVIDIMLQDSQLELQNGIRVDGGVSNDEFLMQFQADMLSTTVKVAVLEEVSAFGSALMAGIGKAFWSLEEATQMVGHKKAYYPTMEFERRNNLYNGWKKAVERCIY